MRYFAVFALLLSVSGCGSMSGPTPQELYNQAFSACSTYGFKQGTDPFASCMMQMDQLQQARAQQNREQIAASLQQLAALNRTTTCTTNAMGSGGSPLGGGFYSGTATTTCN